MTFRGRSVVITGGSRGLGLELARVFAAEGARLSLLARDADELERARDRLPPDADVLAIPCDVRVRDDVEHAVATILDARGTIDVLVNNAGVIQAGPQEHMHVDDFEEALRVHVWGPLYLIRAISPHMRQHGRGRIVNIASIGGMVAVPHLLPYSTSKFALVGLSDGLRAELAPYGIRVTTVVPGLMRTGSHVQALFKGQHEKEFAWLAIADALPLMSVVADRAARQIVEACRYGEARLIISTQAKLLHAMDALFPGATAAIQNLAARLLPGPAPGGDRTKTGWDSTSPLAPSMLTRPADAQIERNNEA